MQTLINKKVVFNPLSKITMTSSLVPVCQFWSDSSTVKKDGMASDIEQRNSMVTLYGNEILTNGGELQVADNGDIMVTRQIEQLYTVGEDQSSQIEKDWYFMNVSAAEYDLMSSYEWSNYEARIKTNILRRYLTEEQRNLIYTSPQAYYEALNEIQDSTAEVVVTVEATLQSWLNRVFPSQLKLIQSPLVESVFQAIKIRQLSISAFTDARTWLFGVARNFYPFLYFKNEGIFDLNYINTAPTKISKIPLAEHDPNAKEIYQKEITSNKKNLMTICKWTNTDYYALPEGWFKTWMYGSPVNTHVIGNMDGIYEGMDVEVNHKGSWIEYNVTINNEGATASLDKLYRKYMYDKYGSIQLVGTKQYKNTTSMSKFLIDYGFSVPVSKLMTQKQTTFKFEEGDKFVVYFCFYKTTKAVSESDYFYPSGEPISSLAYVGTTRVWAKKEYSPSGLTQQPLLQEFELKNDVSMIEKEMWYKQEFEYDETYINDGYTKGSFYYMTKSTQTSSAGFIGITLSIDVDVPSSASYDGAKATYYTSSKSITMKNILSIADMNDTQTIKDTIAVAKYDMMAKLYTYLDMYVKRDMEITGTPTENIDDRLKQILLYGAINKCLVDVDWHTKSVLLNDILPKKQKAIFEVFAKTFNVTDEKIDYFTHIEQVAESEYAYELKTYGGAKSQNQSYTTNNRIQYVPVNFPVDIRDFKKSSVTIYANALVPSISSEIEMGGGFIGKKEYRLMEDIYIKYIVSKSKEFKSGLSNSEIVRFEVDTFNTDGLEELYQDAFPTIRKDIGVILRRITSTDEAQEQQNVYTDNSMITNMMYDHNYLSQTDTIKMNITVYNKD